MAIELTEALQLAELSWRSNYPTGDKRWGLKQLHGLHRLLVDNRDAILATLPTSVPNHVHEHEFAHLIVSLFRHISQLDQEGHAESTKVSSLDGLEVTYRPVGRTVILAGNVSPLRWVLGPLAASLAAGNVTIVCLGSPNERFASLLSREWTRYLDQDSVFLSTSFDLEKLDLDRVDQVSIFGQSFSDTFKDPITATRILTNHGITPDSSTKDYSTILADPKAHIIDTLNAGVNAALINPGNRSWDQITAEIERACKLQLSDRLDVIFVRQDEAGVVRSKLQCSTSTVSLDDVFGSKTETSLRSRIASSKIEGSVLLVTTQSLEAVTDALINLAIPITQLAILGPCGPEVLEFVRRWVPAKLLSVGSICPLPIPELHDPHLQSPSLRPYGFSVPVYTYRDKGARVTDDVASIRATYKSLIKPLKPEPRGERVGFFDQVDYLIKGIGAALGVLVISGLYIGIRRPS
ncbi:hypothetical protein NW762_013237 [Fusarium torreyae]|uniref:Aldehyde dehydrogenase domain-containing protein n=1 Tax=Fusarium torreyae TaxID=1237075 RepID=A0A9W8RPG5_9HYPO|nr:hypothetical protein NW762_013237 [Fusarium torreyae]